MSFISQFIKLYREKIISSRINYSDDQFPSSVLFLTPSFQFQPDTVFIATNNSNLLDKELINVPITVLISDKSQNFEKDCFPNSFNVIVTSFELTELFNHVSQMIALANRWKSTCNDIILEGRGIQDIINMGTAESGKTTLLVNNDFRVTHICSEPTSNCKLNIAMQYGFIPEYITKRININSAKNSSEFFRLTINTEHTSCSIRSIVKDSKLLGYLIFADNSSPLLDLETLSFYMFESILKILNFNHASSYTTSQEFSHVFSDIYEMKLTHRDAILEKLGHLPFSISTYFECIVIKFKQHSHNLLPMNYIINQLQSIFLKHNITSFNNEIIILYSYPDRPYGLDFDQIKLKQLLDCYDGYAAISQGSRKWDWLRSFYILARKTLELGILFRTDPEQRLFTFEEFSMYTIIDMCARHFYKVHKHNNLIHLVPPDIVKLYRYDLNNNLDLRDVLYTYLINNHNIVKTAKKMHMHRNTIQNKIKKIKDLIDVDLEDGRIQERLIFSYQILKYHETFNDNDLDL